MNNNKVYYFGNDGQLYQNKYYTNWGNTYYFGADGSRYSNKFFDNANGTSYFDVNGVRYEDNFYTNWGNVYYFGDNGARLDNQFYSNWNNLYYFGNDGARYTNQFYSNWGNLYYFGNDGARYTNQFYSNWNNLYYFGDNGVLLKNTHFVYNFIDFYANNQGILNLSNSINAYIIANGFRHANVETLIWGGYPTADMQYRTGSPEGVVVHETANKNDSIEGEINYAQNNYENAFVHSYVDASRIINVANTDLKCWGSGPFGNQRFVQFEQVEVHDAYSFASELNNAAYYTAYLLNQYGLKVQTESNGVGTIWSHHNVTEYLGGTDHTDPDGYWSTNASKLFGANYNMDTFAQLVEYYYVQF